VIVVLQRGATPEQVAEAIQTLEKRGVTVRRVDSDGRALLHVVAGPSARARRALSLEQVEGLIPTSGPRVRREGRRFFPYHAMQWAAVLMVALGTLVLLAGQLPPGIGMPVDVQNAPQDVQSPWYLRAPLALLALFPHSLAWLGMIVFTALFLFVPRFERSHADVEPNRLVRFGIAALVLAALAFATLRGGGA
jgi:quinol-cytochrome oxidoreductase complex cytochrome b subunit